MDARCARVLCLALTVGCGRLGYDSAPLHVVRDAGVGDDADVGADADAVPDAGVAPDGGLPVDPTLQRSLAELTFSTTTPPPLRCPVLAADPSSGRVVLYGGYRGDVPYDGMWELRPAGWQLLCEGTCAPGARAGHAFVFDTVNDVFVLFGGETGSEYATNDVWEWDGIAWRERAPLSRPSPRQGAHAAFDPSRGVMVLFGGRAETGGATPLADVWEYGDGVFRGPIRGSGEWPTPRFGCGGATYADARALHPVARSRVVVYGGSRDASYTSPDDVLDDAWAWDGAAERFERVCDGCTGAARSSAAVGFDPRTGRILIAGGYLGESQELSGIWELDESSATLRDPAPTRRDSSGLAYDAQLDRFLLFGGNGDGCPGDCGGTWAYVL